MSYYSMNNMQRRPKRIKTIDEIHTTVLTQRYPDWRKFQGATYDGRATHDILGQNAVMNMLSKGKKTKEIPRKVLNLIGRLTAQKGKMKNRETKMYRTVCKQDKDGERLIQAVRMSNALRRLYNAIPSNYPLWVKYHNWTYTIAAMENLVKPGRISYLCCSDPTHLSLSEKNRWHVRGLTKQILESRKITNNSRPAYLPNAAQFMKWCEEIASENTKDRILLHAEQIKKKTETTMDMLQQYITLGRYKDIFNKGDWGPVHFQQKNFEAIIKLQMRMQMAQYEDKLMKNGMQIYEKIT